MIYVITESRVLTYRSMNKMRKEISLENHELTKVGKDFVVNMTDQTFEIAKDIKLLESVASKRVFTKDKMDMTNWLQIITIICVYFFTK